MNQDYANENKSERDRLGSMVARLTDDDLTRRQKNGWTVAGTLVHLAFWDYYYLALLNQWESSGFAPMRINVDAVNQTVHTMSLTIPARQSVQLVLAAAEAIDQKLTQIPPQLSTQIEDAGHTRILCRAIHRREHLDQIEPPCA